MQASGGLAVNSARRQKVSALNDAERRKAELAIRRDLAIGLQAETEERILTTEGTRAEQAKLAHQADEAQWRKRQAEWLDREAELEAERDGLKAQLAEAQQAVDKANGEAAKRAAEASSAKEQVLQMHASVLEQSAANNSRLRTETARLLAEQKIYLAEVQQAEHEARVHLLEGDEVRKAMSQAVRELVPLRQEVIEQRQQLLEVSRATAQLKNAKEEDQASFMIAKKATAKIMRNKHMKALDVAVAQNKEKQKAREERRVAESQQKMKQVEDKLQDTEAEYREKMRQQALEEEERRQEMADALRKQLESEELARTSALQSDYERQMENERKAASSRLIQTHRRMNTEYKMSMQNAAQQQEKSTAELLQQYADEAQQKLQQSQARADALEAGLKTAQRELAVAQAGLTGMAEVVSKLLHERQEGWEQCEARRADTEADRDAWRGEARRLDAELKRTIARHEKATALEGLERATERAALLAEVATGDEDRAAFWHWRQRANDLGEELSALRKAHQDLLMESRQEQFNLKKERDTKYAMYEDRLAKLKSDYEATKASFERLKKMHEAAKEESKRHVASNGELQQKFAEVRGELMLWQREYEFLQQLFRSECKMEDKAKERMVSQFAAYEHKLNKTAECPIDTLRYTIRDMEDEAAKLAEQVRAMKISMGEELEWQRNETKKVKALVESSRAAMLEAKEARDEMERLMNERVAAAETEAWEVKQAAAKECERMLWMVTAEQEEHGKARQLLADERHARGLEATELERMRESLDRERYARLKAEEASLQSDRRLGQAQGELTDSERDHAEHLEHAMHALTSRLEAELATLSNLDRDARIFQENDDARIAGWQAKVDHWIAKHDALQRDRDELQARFDWLLVRWAGREPREQDVQMMAALQEELSHQMHLTAHAVQAAREYKEALRTNDAAYTHLFGLGALLPKDYVTTHNEIERSHMEKGDMRSDRALGLAVDVCDKAAVEQAFVTAAHAA